MVIRLIDLLDSGARERRIEAARHSIVNKLTAELELLVSPASTEQFPQIKKIASGVNLIETEVGSKTQAAGIASSSENYIESIIKESITNIRTISADLNGQELKYFWKAIEDQRLAGRVADVGMAIGIAKKTLNWSNQLGVDHRAAFRLSVNAHKLERTKGIPLDDAKAILQLAGRLSTKHGVARDAALQFAMDNRLTLQKLNVGMDSIERIIKSLDKHLPTLRHMPQITRISAAIRYLQLQGVDLGDKTPIEVIAQSIADLPLLQQGMPRGCIIDQIHQGAHVRGQSKHVFPQKNQSTNSIDNAPTAPEQELTNRANSLMRAKRLGSTRETVLGVSLPEVFCNFNEQHVKDLLRGSRFEIRTDGKPNEAFREIEEKRRENPKNLNKEMYQTWANERIDWAGSVESAGLISHLESQSIFADIQKFTNEQFRNGQAYAMVTGGGNVLTRTHFVADKTTVANSTVFKLDLTNYRNETTLSAMPADNLNGNKTLLPLVEIKVPLLPNPGPDKVAGPHGFSLKRKLQMELEPAPLKDNKEACRIFEVSEEWDLLIDWDSWIKDS